MSGRASKTTTPTASKLPLATEPFDAISGALDPSDTAATYQILDAGDANVTNEWLYEAYGLGTTSPFIFTDDGNLANVYSVSGEQGAGYSIATGSTALQISWVSSKARTHSCSRVTDERPQEPGPATGSHWCVLFR